MTSSKGRLSDNKLMMMAHDFTDTDMASKDIAKKYGICASSMYKALTKMGVPPRKRKQSDWEKLRERYQNSRLEEDLD